MQRLYQLEKDTIKQKEIDLTNIINSLREELTQNKANLQIIYMKLFDQQLYDLAESIRIASKQSTQ